MQRLGQLRPIPLAREHLSDLSIWSKEEAKQAEPNVELQQASKLTADASTGEGGRKSGRQIENVAIEESDEIVLLAHDAIGDIVSIKTFVPTWRQPVRHGLNLSESGRMLCPQCGKAFDDDVPGYGLDVGLASARQLLRCKRWSALTSGISRSSSKKARMSQSRLIALPNLTARHAQKEPKMRARRRVPP